MKILFITHESSRTGAPLVLLHFIQWLRSKKTEVSITVVDLKVGNLAKVFELNSHFYYSLESFELPKKRLSKELKKKVFQKIGMYRDPEHPKDSFFKELAKVRFDIIYANSVVSLPVANHIKNLSPDSKLVLHVHELKTVIDGVAPNFEKEVLMVDKFIAVSNIVREQLINTYFINSEIIEIVYEFSKLNTELTHKKEKEFVVGGSGTVHWRKGSDIFIQVARYLKTNHQNLNIKFEWIGAISEKNRRIYEADIEKANLQNTVKFVGEKEEPGEFYRNFDIFLLCSREDPFPLVAIEVGQMGKPIICFENATGTSEILNKGGGEVVPYFELETLAEKILEYYNDEVKLDLDSKKVRDLFLEFSPDNICPVLFNAIKG